MPSDAFSYPFIQSELRAQLPFFAIASVVFVAGISSLLLAALRSRDRLLFWVGIFSIMYGARLFTLNGLLHTATGVDDRDILPWTFCLTYSIPIPFAAFARELFGSGWKKSILVWLWIEIAFAALAIPFVLFSRHWQWPDSVNGYLVIGGTLLILLHIILQRESTPQAKGLTWPLIVFAIFVLLENRRYTPAGVNIEPIGFVVLLGGLGLTASRRSIARERKLLEVEQELSTARRIQNSTIPDSSPNVPGISIATRYQPMSAVAGDFFDFIRTGENALTVLVADVSGHGVPAALVASMLKVCFAAQRERAGNPAEVLISLNRMLSGSLGGQFVTAACAAIDLAQNTVTYAGAGHPPSLLFRNQTNEIVPLAENGLFIGPFPHATYSNITAAIAQGDKLLLYTDGIVEAAGPDGNEFGQHNVEKLLLSTRESPPAECIRQLFQKIYTPDQQDDLTVVLAQFH